MHWETVTYGRVDKLEKISALCAEFCPHWPEILPAPLRRATVGVGHITPFLIMVSCHSVPSVRSLLLLTFSYAFFTCLGDLYSSVYEIFSTLYPVVADNHAIDRFYFSCPRSKVNSSFYVTSFLTFQWNLVVTDEYRSRTSLKLQLFANDAHV